MCKALLFMVKHVVDKIAELVTVHFLVAARLFGLFFVAWLVIAGIFIFHGDPTVAERADHVLKLLGELWKDLLPIFHQVLSTAWRASGRG